MTHPFHPPAGRDFEFVEHRQNWGEDRVHLHDEDGQLFSLPAGWTDAGHPSRTAAFHATFCRTRSPSSRIRSPRAYSSCRSASFLVISPRRTAWYRSDSTWERSRAGARI
ncbi:MAG: DUF5372 family protein [Streptosporangiaceae bacterium]